MATARSVNFVLTAILKFLFELQLVYNQYESSFCQMLEDPKKPEIEETQPANTNPTQPIVPKEQSSPKKAKGPSKGSACVVLLKKIPAETTKEQIRDQLKAFGEITHIKILKHKLYGYVEYSTVEAAKNCVDHYAENQLLLHDSEVTAFLTGTGKQEMKPLDLNPPSRILLLTFFKNRIPISISLVVDMLGEFDQVDKVKLTNFSNSTDYHLRKTECSCSM